MVPAAYGRGERVSGVVRSRVLGEAEEEAHHGLHLLLVRSSGTDDGLLDGGGAEVHDLEPDPPEDEADGPADLGDGKGARYVSPEIDAFHARRRGLPVSGEGFDLAGYREDALAQGTSSLSGDAAMREVQHLPVAALEDAPAGGGEPGIDP